MASFADAFAALDDYRSTLLEAQQNEDPEAAQAAFSARGGFSAFSTPLTNVHATGVGIRLRAGKIVKNDFVIKVYVFDKQDLGKRTPKVTGEDFQGIGIDVEHLPIQQALAKSGARALAGTTPTQHQKKHRPVIGGIRIGPLGASRVGTLGLLVRRGADLFALSNNHILAGTNRLRIGTPIVQPFGTSEGDKFAMLSEIERILFPGPGGTPRNRMDAAIAAVTNPSLVQTGTILGIPNYKPQLLAPRPSMRVRKSGQKTGVTTGVVMTIGVNSVLVNYGTAQSPIIGTFDNCVAIRPAGQLFYQRGDSGSAIVDVSSGRPVGLLFTGDGFSATACDLTAVCTQFRVVPA